MKSLQLADYRRTVAETYSQLRQAADPVRAAAEWRQSRDDLFKQHSQSPIEDQEVFSGLRYAPYDARWRFVVPVESNVAHEIFTVELPEGVFEYERVGRVQFTTPDGTPASLFVYWVLGYGGGLFLPFGDQTNQHSTYGGGRYLYDTIKGADLGAGPERLVLDFNFAYHPSCYYSPRWTCPLAPPENRLPFAVPVGELVVP